MGSCGRFDTLWVSGCSLDLWRYACGGGFDLWLRTMTPCVSDDVPHRFVRAHRRHSATNLGWNHSPRASRRVARSQSPAPPQCKEPACLSVLRHTSRSRPANLFVDPRGGRAFRCRSPARSPRQSSLAAPGFRRSPRIRRWSACPSGDRSR